jgi:hypothetical protein
MKLEQLERQRLEGEKDLLDRPYKNKLADKLGIIALVLIGIIGFKIVILMTHNEGYNQAKEKYEQQIKPVQASEIVQEVQSDHIPDTGKMVSTSAEWDAWGDIQSARNPITEEQRWRISQNWEAYVQSGCDPYWMASLHRRETGFDVANNNPFQLPANLVSPDPTFAGLIADAKTACDFLKNKVGGELPLPITKENISLWADATWKYNGTAYGSWDKSPFVVSNLDSSKTNLHKCAVDGCSYTIIDRLDGVMTTYLKLVKE